MIAYVILQCSGSTIGPFPVEAYTGEEAAILALKNAHWDDGRPYKVMVFDTDPIFIRDCLRSPQFIKEK